MPAPKKSASSLFAAILGTVGFSALAGLLVTVMVAPALAVTGMTANNTLGIFESLPEYMVIDTQSQQNQIVAKNADGTDFPIATVFAQNRQELALDQMSDNLKNAAVAGEDRRFYDHGGIDVPSVVRAAIGQAAGTSSSGASTITMQLVRNIRVQEAFAEPSDTDAQKKQRDADLLAATYPDLGRKLQEMKYAIGLEKKYSKQTILAAYLNIVGMGQNTYGVQAAAQEYFGTSASNLTVAQAASLVAIVQNPTKNGLFDPKNYAANEKRRDVILGFMQSEHYISDAQYKEAIATKVDANFVHLSKPTQGCLNATEGFQFVCDYAVRSVKNGEISSLGADKGAQIAAWNRGGYKLYVSVSPSLQQTAIQIVQSIAPPNETRFQLGAAAVTVQVGTGRIIDIATNKGYSNLPNNTDITKTSVDYAADFVHGGSTGFQPGSTYKPYTLLSFLAAGHGVNESFNAGIRQLDQSAFADRCNGPWGGPYKFKNDANEQGVRTIMNATAQSINSVFLQMGTKVDQCDTRDIAISLGVHRADGAADGLDLDTEPSCVIGGCKNNIAPITQAAAFAAIANQGVFCQPILIDAVIDPSGNTLPGQNANCGQSAKVTPDVANTAAYAMAGVLKGTAAASNPNDGTTYIGKTGTTDASVHTWMVGSSTATSTAVWVGNVQGTQAMRTIRVTGSSASVLRHRIFKPLAQAIDKVYPGHAFPAPAKALLTGSPAFVPDGLIGGTPEQAQAAITTAELTYADGGPVDSDQPVGTVASTNPGGGAQVPRGTTVTVYTSNGLAVQAPNVSGNGTNYNDGRTAFQGRGFTNISQGCVVAQPGDPVTSLNTIVSQVPAAGAVVNKSTPVTLTIRKISC
jgi:membrane peptidoglycan carboxypeptidase